MSRGQQTRSFNMRQFDNMLISDVLRANATLDDGRAFLHLVHMERKDELLSYRDLLARGELWNATFRKAGLEVGSRVVVILPHSVDLYAAYLGALLGGLVPTMFAFPSPKFSEEVYFQTIGALLDNADAHIIVTYSELASSLREKASGVIHDTIIVTPLDISDEPIIGDRLPLSVTPDSIAFLQYSSGTTGVKKGVAVSHQALLGHIDAYTSMIGAGEGDKIVSWLPLYHDMGLIACFFLPMVMRIPVVAISPFDWVRRPAMWPRAVAKHSATLSWLPNFAFSFMAANVSKSDTAELDLSSLRGVVNCSEPIMAESCTAFVERFSENGFTQEMLASSYAMAENTFAVTSGGFGHPVVKDTIDTTTLEADGKAMSAGSQSRRVRTLVSSGRALPDTEVHVIDPDGRALGERQLGQIVISSPALMNEYYRNPEATATTVRENRYFTGDLGYMVDGELFVTGRVQDLIIIGGKNIYPQDIEAAIMKVEGIIPGRVAAVGIEQEALGTQSLVVLAETKETDPAIMAMIRQEVFKVISAQTEVVPTDVYLTPSRWLRKSTSGKVSRKASKELYVAQHQQNTFGVEDIDAERLDDSDVLSAVRRCVKREVKRSHLGLSAPLKNDTPLLTSGAIDSFGLASLILGLESALAISIPDQMLTNIDDFDSIKNIARTVSSVRENTALQVDTLVQPVDAQSISMTGSESQLAGNFNNFWTLMYRTLFRLKGIQCGPGFHALGPLMLQIDGHAKNIRIGRNVTLMPGVHLKVRENGRIILHDGVKLDTNVRLVSANDAKIEIGERTVLGMGTCLNAGMDILIGKKTLISAYCMLNASDHGIAKGMPMREQSYEHAPIYIGEDAWLGVHVFVSKCARIGNGAIISAGSVATGVIPDFAIAQGSPARTIKFRSSD